MEKRIPVKAWEHASEEFPNNRTYKAAVYPENMLVLRNSSANADSNIIYLHFRAMENKSVRATISERFSEPPVCGRHCETCKYYSPHFAEIGYDGDSIRSMRRLNEGRCIRARIPGKRTKGADICEHWKGKNE